MIDGVCVANAPSSRGARIACGVFSTARYTFEMALRLPEITAPARVAERSDQHDSLVVLEGAGWSDFQRVLELRAERPVPRMSFDNGRLELMSPSRTHEYVNSMIGCLVEGWCFERNVDITPYGSWTLEDKAARVGLEPDKCYVVGDVRNPTRPDLAIEVVWTSGGIDKLSTYQKLAVREVWFWVDGKITVYALRVNGADGYVALPASHVLEGIDLSLLSTFVDVTPMTRAVRAYRDALKTPRG